MRIGFFAGNYLMSGGSITAIVEPLAKALQGYGHEVFVLDLALWRSKWVEANGLPVYVMATIPALFRHPVDAAALLKQRFERLIPGLIGNEQRGTLAAFSFLVGKLQRSFAISCHLDVLYSFHFSSFPGLCNLRMPEHLFLVVNFIGFGISPKRGGDWDTFPYWRYIFKRPFWDLHITATKFEYRQYKKVYEGIGLPVDKLTCLPHSFDETLFRPLLANERAALRRQYGLEEDHCVLVYPVNIHWRKNIELALDITARMQKEMDTTLIVTGRVWDEGYYKRLLDRVVASGLENRVRFLRGIPRKNFMEVLNLADVTVFPSHQETFGLGIVESLGCGTPVVGPGYIHPCREILTSTPGGWIANKDADDFCRQVLKALQSRPNREHIAAEARRRFGNRSVARQWLAQVQVLREQKLARQAYLENLDWAALYEDDLDLSKEINV